MPPCLIAIDIDGTLLNTDGQVSPRNRAALHAAHRAGVEIVIATGRRHTYAMRVVRDLHLHEANALISSNGAVIRTVGQAELIHRRHFPLETACWLCQYIPEFHDTLVFTFDNVGPDGEDQRGALVCEASNALHSSVGNWMKTNEPYIRNVEHIGELFSPPSPVAGEEDVSAKDVAAHPDLYGAPIQAMLCGSVDRMARAEALLAAHPAVAAVGQPELPGAEIALHRTAYPERDLVILDILPAGCSKASALEYLAALRGCTLTETMAIGDNWNDLPMLQAAGTAIVMGNAPAELRQIAAAQGWTVGPTNNEDGVAVAIETALRSVSNGRTGTGDTHEAEPVALEPLVTV